jgi:hypothetical protein
VPAAGVTVPEAGLAAAARFVRTNGMQDTRKTMRVKPLVVMTLLLRFKANRWKLFGLSFRFRLFGSDATSLR